MGAALNVIRDGFTRLAVSFGSTFHYPDSLNQNSGLYAGLSVINLSPKVRSSLFGLNIGGAYWVKPNTVRWQVAWRLQGLNGAFVTGAEARINPWFSLHAGTESFKKASGGLSIKSSYLNCRPFYR